MVMGKHIGAFPKWSRTFIEFSEFREFRESDKSLKHELGCPVSHVSCWCCGSILASGKFEFFYCNYHPQVCEGYVFTPVCQSFCSGGVCLSACGDSRPPDPPDQTPPLGADPLIEFIEFNETFRKNSISMVIKSTFLDENY